MTIKILNFTTKFTVKLSLKLHLLIIADPRNLIVRSSKAARLIQTHNTSREEQEEEHTSNQLTRGRIFLFRKKVGRSGDVRGRGGVSVAVVCMLIERGAIWNGPSQWLPVDYHGKYSGSEFSPPTTM